MVRENKNDFECVSIHPFLAEISLNLEFMQDLNTLLIYLNMEMAHTLNVPNKLYAKKKATARYYKRDDDHMVQIVLDLIKILQFFSCRRSHRRLVLSTKFWLFHKLQYAQIRKQKKNQPT